MSGIGAFATSEAIRWGLRVCTIGLAWGAIMLLLFKGGKIQVISSQQPAEAKAKRLSWEWLPAVREFANARARAHGQPAQDRQHQH